jgi:Tfp pilus assembly protein PilF
MLSVIDTLVSPDQVEGAEGELIRHARAKLAAADDADKSATTAEEANITEMMARGQFEKIWNDFGSHPNALDSAEQNLLAWAAVGIGNALLAQARTKQGDAADALFGQAGEKYAAALSIKPDKHEALNNWGNALSDQARTKQGEAADALFGQAGEKYTAALATKPDLYEALNNWGGALSTQAMAKQGDASDALFAAAGEKYAAALELKPDSYEALYNLGVALCQQARTKQGDAADALFAQAEEKLNKSEALKPGSGAYDLACFHGLRGDAASAAQWLRKAKQLDTNCPDCAHILADKDFDTVRTAPEFIAALTDIGCPPPA